MPASARRGVGSTVAFTLPGAGPFRTKGNLYRGGIEMLRHLGIWDAVLAALPDDEHRQFFSQTFLAGSWYDLFPVQTLDEVASVLRGVTLQAHIQDNTKFQFGRDVNGLYRLLLRFSNPSAMVERVNRLSAQYFDFGESEVSAVQPRSATVTRRGVPTTLAPWFAEASISYVKVAMRAAGAKQVHSAFELEPGGIARLTPLSTIHCSLTWTQ